MSNTYTYIIELKDRVTGVLRKTGAGITANTKKVDKLKTSVNSLNNSSLSKLGASFSGLFHSISPVMLLTAGMYKLNKAIGESQQAYKAQGVVEKQLATVMRNTMDARREDIQSILDLASAQQKLGVIGDEVQLAGAQELATYLGLKSSLEKLMPVMNDMLAQQYGLGASQEQAAQIASMLGKVMDGQVGALSRYGYKFDELQEKILKNGTEAQRAAVLFDVVNESVGGVNQALAQTPEGRLKQQANDLGDLGERLGKIVITVKNSFSSLTEWFIKLSDSILAFFERNGQKIETVMSVVSTIFVKVFDGIVAVIEKTKGIYNGFITGINDGNPVIITLTGLFIGLTTAVAGYKLSMLALAGLQTIILGLKKVLVAYEIVVFAIKNATSLWAAAQWLLNAALALNPVGLIIAGVVSLIAFISYLIFKIDGWGETWSNVVAFCKTAFDSFKVHLELGWLHIKDTFLSGFEIIERGWYKLQSLWDKDAASQGLAKLENDRNNRAAEIAAKQQTAKEINEQLASMKVFSLRFNDKSLSDVVKGLTSKLGIAPAGIAGMGGSNSEEGDGSGDDDEDGSGGNAASTANAIATGGSKTTHININLGSLVHTMSVTAGSVKESGKQIRDIILDELSRTLTMAQANV